MKRAGEPTYRNTKDGSPPLGGEKSVLPRADRNPTGCAVQDLDSSCIGIHF